jgi:hypothetical protein
MRFLRFCAFSFAALALAGCAPSRGNFAEILIETNPPGAACTIVRAEQPVAVVDATPGIVNLDSAAATGLSVACRRRGYADIAVALPPNGAANAWRYPEPQSVLIPLAPVRPRALTR